jgi:hypothetical protein
MGVVIEICIKYPGGPTRMRVTDITVQVYRYSSPCGSYAAFHFPLCLAPKTADK